MNKKTEEDGLSEIVSSLSLIIVLVIAAGVILSFTTAQYPKETLPYADILPIEGSGYVNFSHIGGENLSADSIQIRVIFENGTYESYDKSGINIISPDGNSIDWDTYGRDLGYGYSMGIPVKGNNLSYQIILKKGGGEFLYREFGRSEYVGGLPIPTIPTPTPAPNITCSLTELDAKFYLTQTGTNPPTYQLSSTGNGTHSYTILGKDFSRTINGKQGVITLPNLTTDHTYLIIHSVIQKDNNYPVCSRSSSQSLMIHGCSDSCHANFIYESDPNNRMNISFKDSSEGIIVSRQWNFGDGHTSIEENPYHIYSTPSISSYKVTLTIGKNQCGSRIYCSSTKQVFLDCSGNADFSWVYDSSSRKPWNVTFTWNAGSFLFNKPYTLIWDFGDGSRKSILSSDWSGNIPHSYYNECKDYSATLTVNTRDCGSYSATKTVSLPCICNQTPISNFSVEKSHIGTPFVISITDNTTHADKKKNIVKWIWDMGDGTVLENSSKPGTFTYSYPGCGDYSLLLTTFDELGCWDSTIRKISCGGDTCTPGIPNASFVYSVNGREVQFTDQSKPEGNIQRWQWDMGDGTRYTTQNTTHTYLQYGNYTVKLRVWDQDGCFGDTIRDVSLTCPQPEANFTLISDPVNPQKYSFIDNSVIPAGLTGEYHWDFGDETSYIGKNPPDKTYVNCGQFTVRLRVMTDCGSSDDIIKDAICGCPPPISKFEYTCIGSQLVSFTDLSRATGGGIKSWYWEFGDLRFDNISGLQNPYHEYDYPGTYPVNLTVFTTCNSSARWTRYVAVPCCQMPTPDFTYTCLEDGNTIQFNDTTKLYGDTISSWNWDFGDGTTPETIPNPRKRYENPGTYPVNLTVTTACGARNSYVHDITVPCLCSPPTAFFRTEIISTDPFTIRITDLPDDESITNWNWSFGDGASFTGKNPPDHPYTECGEYLITLQVTNDCRAIDDYKQLVCCPVYANFTYRMEPLDGTAPVTVYFTDRTSGTPSAWSWLFGDGGFSSFRNPVHTYTKGGNYSVTLHATSHCGGNETHSQRINVFCPPVEALFNYAVVNEDPLTVQFTDLSTGYDIVEWNWFFGDGTSSTDQNPLHIYNIRADYQVILTIKNSCGSESTNTMYLPIGCLPLTIVATAHEGGTITPSGDVSVPCGWNQQFEIMPDPCYTIREVIIDEGKPYEVNLGPVEFYTFNDVQMDYTIDAYFDLKTFFIDSSAGPGGAIDPPGMIEVDCGSDQTYTVTANPCYNITNVIINGTVELGPQQSPFSYTFTNVTSDQSIHAMFARKTFPITATAGMGGSISPSGILYVPCGFDQTYTITSNECYNITSVIVDGSPLPGPFTSPFTYTFTNVQESHTIHAEFTQRSYIITAEAGPGGTITPSGSVTVLCGDNQRFDITPDSGYAILNVLVNGISVGPVSSYTFTNVQANQTIQALFTVKRDCYTISGRITNQLTGAPVAGIRVDAYFQASPQTFQAYATSQPDGYYIIYLPYPPPPAPRTYFVRCPDTTTWVTTNPPSKQINNIDINPGGGAKCDPVGIDFQGRLL